ncbi:hypothetical protein ABPG75_013344 [Micractinium tetrahymenae]
MAEPAGLGMSLDDLISKQRDQQEGGYGKQRRGGPRAGGGGRGGRGRGGRGRSGDRMEEDWQGGPRRQQQQSEQPRGQWQQQQQYGQQQQRGPGRGGQGQGQRYDMRQHDPTAYRQHQKCFQKDTGEVVFRFMQSELVRIDPSGAITLSSGGYHNATTLASLNDALNLIGIRITCPSGDVSSGEWSISDGRSLTRFADGVVLPAKGPQHAGRGRQLLQAFNNPNHAQQLAAAAASNAAATAAGILPFTGFVPPGVPAPRMTIVQMAPAPGPAAARPSVFARLGGVQQQQGQCFAPY